MHTHCHAAIIDKYMSPLATPLIGPSALNLALAPADRTATLPLELLSVPSAPQISMAGLS